MSFLCPSVGLLKFRKFTKLGLHPSRNRGIRSRVRNRGTSVSFERAESEVSIASQGGFSALYGEVNPISHGEEELTEDSAVNCGEYFAGIYIGGDARNSQKSVRDVSNSDKPSEAMYFTQNPATVQSFTFFEESLLSSQHNEGEMAEEDENDAEVELAATPNEQQMPLLVHSSTDVAPPTPKSSGNRARYHLPNWVRQRRCLPTLNEVDFDKIDAISLRSLSISSEMGNEDINNNIIVSDKGSDHSYLQSTSRISKVDAFKQQGSAKRTHCDNLCDGAADNVQIQYPPQHQLLQSHGSKLAVYSPKKTKRNESETTDDSVFIREPFLQQHPAVDPRPQVKLRPSKTSKVNKSPSLDNLRRRSKKRESLRKAKQLGNSGNDSSKVSAKNSKNAVGRNAMLKDTENVGSLVRSKPLYMRATSERALDPSAMKLRLESSTARKWQQTGGSSPLSEVTNVSHPQSSMCLRMEIVQRPVIHRESHQEKAAMSPRKTRDLRQGSLKLPAGKIRPTPQWSKQFNTRDHVSRKRASLRLKSTETKTSSRPGNLTVKEENIDTIFGNNISSKEGQTLLANVNVNQRKFGHFQHANHEEHTNLISEVVAVTDKTYPSGKLSNIDINCHHVDNKSASVLREDLSSNTTQVKCSRRKVLIPGKNASREGDNVGEIDTSTLAPKRTGGIDVNEVLNTETGVAQVEHKQPGCLIHKPRFAANSIKEARIVSTSKTVVDADPEDSIAPPLPPKMMKSASFAGPSQADAAKNNTVSKSTTRSATNVRALQTPLTQQQRRKLRRSAPGNRNGGPRRVSAVEASREDITEVVAAMKVSLDPAKPKERSRSRRGTSFTKKSIGDAEVVYDFEARNEDDITIKIGEIVTVMNKDDPDWLFVKKHSGQQEGFVPRIFLQLKVKEESIKSDIASEVQTAQDNSTSSVIKKVEQKQSSLTTIPETTAFSQTHLPQFSRRIATDQVMGSAEESIPPSAPLASEDTCAVPVIHKSTDQSHSYGGVDSRCHHPSSKSKLGKISDQYRPRDFVHGHKFNTNARPKGTTPAVLIETYIVVNDYTGQDEDEVSVVEGEVIVVNSEQQHELDWMWVYVPRTEMFGFVPAFNASPLGFHYSDV